MASVLLTACGNATPPATLRPQLSVMAPVEGERFAAGQRIPVAIAAVASNTITQVEFTLGGAPAQTRAIDAPQAAVSTGFDIVPASEGRLTLAVTAIDAKGLRSEPIIVHIVVGNPDASGVIVPTALSGPAQPSVAPPCALSAEFVADVSIPDGTLVQPGASFIKTWRMRNNSPCAWPPGYRLAFLENEPMRADTQGDTLGPIAQGQEFDISLALTAPQQGGIYTSTWRLRDLSGTSFGNRIYVAIRVP